MMSNSGEATGSPSPNPTNPVNKKRNLPGNPDPDAEVIALSPKTLMAANRFRCGICNKGFQRDENLQLHKRGHNLPWKLKERAKADVVRKKVTPTMSHPVCTTALPGLLGTSLGSTSTSLGNMQVQSDWKAQMGNPV